MPDALSQMYETEEEEFYAAVVTADNWYNTRVADVTRDLRRYLRWQIVESELYHRKPNATTEIVEDRNQWKLVVPQESRRAVMRENHDTLQAGHLGTEKTYRRIALRYHWPRMFQDIARYVRRCDVRQRIKVEQDVPAGLMGQRVPDAPWTIVTSDIKGPLPASRNGHVYLLVLQDLFTKWIECRPLRKATGKNIQEAIEELVVFRWGVPQVLLTDNGTEFINQALRKLTESYGIYHITVPPYHLQANPVERVNRVLKTMITSFIEQDHREWDRRLNEFRFAYNSAHHTSLQATPAFLNFGREPLPVGMKRDADAREVEVEAADPEEWRERMSKMGALRR